MWYVFKKLSFLENIYTFIFYFISVCKEALEVLTICLFLRPSYLSQLMEKKDWQTFFIDLILLANNRYCSYT